MRASRIAGVVLAAALLAVSCGDDGGDGGRKATLVLAYPSEPVVLDGARTRDVSASRVASQIFETLVKHDPGTTTIVPGLAQSWEASPDGRTWTFRLRTGVRFHDGTAFDASAVCANFDRWYNARGILQAESLSGPWRTYFEGFATKDLPDSPEQSVFRSCQPRAVDTVTLSLTQPLPRMLSALAAWGFGMASPDALRRYEADKWSGTPPRFEGTFGTEHPVGTGPFRFESWIRDDRLVLVRNDDYWGGAPTLERLVFRAIGDGAARRQALESGEIDGYEPVDPADVVPLRRAGFQVHMRQPLNVSYVALNQATPLLRNLEVRQAIAHAINREAWVRAKYLPDTLLATAFVPPFVAGFAEDVRTYPYDPDRARRLLDESGADDPTLELWYPTGTSLPHLVDPEGEFQAVKADLERVGFRVVGRPAPFQPDYVRAVVSGTAQMYFGAVYSDVDPDGFLGQFANPRPAFGFEHQRLFDLLRSARVEVDPGRRTAMYQEANRLLMEQLPAVPVLHVRPLMVMSRAVTGYQPHPIGPIESLATAGYAR
ncbi:MAG TPA: ABC transporter substrate-binding protein [Acidimicrobiales bacterium]|nr:ABC transporter substrate-binding protein [Acidimicrobiales bacterium]